MDIDILYNIEAGLGAATYLEEVRVKALGITKVKSFRKIPFRRQ